MRKCMIMAFIVLLCFTGCSKADNTKQSSEIPSSAEVQESSQAVEESSAVTSQSSDTDQTGITYQMSIPEGYTELEMEGIEFYYMYEDGSNINMNIQDKDSGFSLVTADMLNAALVSTFKQTYEIDLTITDNYFTTNEISGYPSYQYCISYEFQGIPFTQLIVGIDADRTYTFTFTDVAGGAWMTAFEESAKSIVITP